MDIKYIMKVIILLIVVMTSLSFKNKLRESSNTNEAIKTAITDFSKTRLFNKGSVFSIIVNEENSEDILTISIMENNMKLLLNNDFNVNSSRLPSQYLEIKEKLFFWWDKSLPLSSETISVYKKYNILQDDENGIIQFPDFTIDDNKKGAHYFFCKKSLKFKRVITSKGIGYYPPPKLKC